MGALALNLWLLPLGMLAGGSVVALAAWPLLRRVTHTPPSEVLRAN